jgi:peptidyl-prolyl cis-trans isomerase D
MMSTLRDKKTMQFILWILIAAFVIGFLFLAGGRWLIKEDTRNLVATVGDEKITYSDFSKVYQPASDRLYGSKTTEPTQEEIANLKKQVLNRLIDNVILEKTAAKLGITVSLEEIAASIQRQNYFLDENGKFDKNRYYQVLQSNQLTPEEFEASERNQILQQKIHSVLNDGILFTNQDVDNYKNLLSRDLKAVFVVMNPEKYEQQNKPTEEELRSYYETNQDKYDHQERAKVRHILLGLSGSENITDQEKAKKTLSDYRDQILSGKAQFSDLAKKFSQDTGSNKSGGELGWITRGITVKEFEDNVFNLKKGEISKPFKTQFGYHIAQLEDYEKPYKSKFSEVRSKVLVQYKKEKAVEKIVELSQQISLKLEDKGDLTKIASQLGLPTQTTPWFNRSKGIPNIKDSKDAADKIAGLYVRDWQGPLSIGANEYFFQIIDSKESNLNSKSTDAQEQIVEKMLPNQQSYWIKNFLDSERKKLDVKIYQNG